MPSSPPCAVVWFRDDLRVGDNPALVAAAATGLPLLCVYVLDEVSPGVRPLGGASRWWLHGALADLSGRLDALGARLDLYRGAAATVLPALAGAAGAVACFWNRRYDSGGQAADAAVADALGRSGVVVETSNGSLLHEPGTVLTKAGTRFSVFTPYRNAALARGFDAPVPTPAALPGAPPVEAADAPRASLDALRLLPTQPDWAGGLRDTWTPGEAAAQERLAAFLGQSLNTYGEGRDRPAVPAMSRLSPSLRFGEISPRQVVAQAHGARDAGTAPASQADKFVSEVVWRDFAYGILAARPDIAEVPMQAAFARFPYREAAPEELDAWRHGRTGFPIVDAGMRQLWQTGTMHNRVRMITASFLVKDLLVDWRVGEDWFWDTLCDADPANNPMNWQWVAGCGVDAAPFFRIFNPVLQGETFDPDGTYVRAFVPELARLPRRWIHQPWSAPAAVLDQAGVRLGTTYPRPMLDHAAARDRARAAFAAWRRGQAPEAP